MARLIPAALDALILLVTALLSWLMPGLTRQQLLFGVTVPAGAHESPAGRGIIARYRVAVLAVLVAHARAVSGAASSRFRALWLRYLYVLRVLMLAFFGGIAIVVALSANGTLTGTEWILPAAVALVAFVLGGAILLALRTGQGGARLGPVAETGTDHMDDHYWKLGAIYVNPHDPSIFVERRFGIGWTINLGNPRGIALMLALLALPIGSILLATLLGAAHR